MTEQTDDRDKVLQQIAASLAGLSAEQLHRLSKIVTELVGSGGETDQERRARLGLGSHEPPFGKGHGGGVLHVPKSGEPGGEDR